jgi:hypothetical protein
LFRSAGSLRFGPNPRLRPAEFYCTTRDGIDDRLAASGIYFYRLETAGTMTTKKMILLK